MTPAIPPDAKRVVLAAVVPCWDRRQRELGWPCWDEDRDRCPGCLGDRTRTVVTDIEVEAREVVVPGAPTETWWRPT